MTRRQRRTILQVGERCFVQYEESEGTITEITDDHIAVLIDSDNVEVLCAFEQVKPIGSIDETT